MSNVAVGPLYKRIIDSVIEASRTDFEENGVDNRMIQMLQDKWQKHVSGKRTAQFPWDPAPEQAQGAEPAQAPTKSAAAKKRDPSPAPAPQPVSQQQAPVNVKSEPGSAYENNFNNYPQSSGGNFTSNPDVAQQRAAHLVQQRYPNQAQSMNLGNIHLPGQQGSNGQRAGPPYQNQQQFAQQQQQRPAQSPSTSQPSNWSQQQQNGAPQVIKKEPNDNLANSQTDGAADKPSASGGWTAVMAHRHAAENDGPTGRRAADHMLREHVKNHMRYLEGGGLLQTLDERYPGTTAADRREVGRWKPNSAQAGPSRFDGGDEDVDIKDEDVDAINSDLDDPDDDAVDAMVGDDYHGDIIICLYDKVQRVKNKWKCTLKDGVVSIDGKDYVFHKANGEFEW